MRENERKEHSIMEAFKETALSLAPAWRELFFTLSFLGVLWYDISVFERMVARWRY